VCLQVSEYARNASKLLVMLGSSIDSREVKHHLNAYHRFVSEDSYLIVQDTFHGNAEVATKAFLSERKVNALCPFPHTEIHHPV
jgi:cephalosporin hydroxylase